MWSSERRGFWVEEEHMNRFPGQREAHGACGAMPGLEQRAQQSWPESCQIRWGFRLMAVECCENVCFLRGHV